jgi:hypothetical protein
MNEIYIKDYVVLNKKDKLAISINQVDFNFEDANFTIEGNQLTFYPLNYSGRNNLLIGGLSLRWITKLQRIKKITIAQINVKQKIEFAFEIPLAEYIIS